MNWPSVFSPQVIAPTFGFLGVLVGAGVSAWTTRSTHKDRLAADQALAERKVTADIDLAERKFRFDKGIIAWRRQYELAEQVLGAAYEACDALNYARGRLIRADEGKTRIATEPESQQVREARDSAFIPIERLAARSKAFATLQTLQDPMLAHFGTEALQPISEISSIYHGITSAVGILIQNAAWNEEQEGRRALQPFRDELWGDKAKESAVRLDAAVKQLEAICKPILSGHAPV
jgi:hypothetical protein